LSGEGAGTAVAGNTGDAEGFVDEELGGVFANGVVGDERGACWLPICPA